MVAEEKMKAITFIGTSPKTGDFFVHQVQNECFFLGNWEVIIFVAEIKYAKPKRGKTAQGVWKDIVNVNDYTQTLRMEKCMWVILKQSIFCNNEINFCYCRKPGGQCSYVSHHYKSQCSQVYNYHRLLSWDKERGLHMDIYKVCCM